MKRVVRLQGQGKMKAEGLRLAGPKHKRTGGVRWGHQRGSIYRADQKLPITDPRVRDLPRNQELPLRAADVGLFRKVLVGLSCRDDDACVARVLDGQPCAEDRMVIALGITLTDEKVLLGFVQTATENEPACAAFLRDLLERGLPVAQGLLVVIDGAKRLRKALQTVFGAHAVVRRWQWHKREKVLAYLPKGQRARVRRTRQAAYEPPLVNDSAVKSLDEGVEETLTLHRLGVVGLLGRSLKTTNCLESLKALLGQRTAKVDRWRTSDQQQRWLTAALLDIEPRLRRIKGFRALPVLRQALHAELGGELRMAGTHAA